MRCLCKNRQSVYYALYSGKTAVTDTDGNLAGEYTVAYGTPTEIKANISASSGSASNEAFGIEDNYSKTIVLENSSVAFDTATVWWVGISPTNNTPHNYKTVKVAKSLNSTTIAIKEDDVS